MGLTSRQRRQVRRKSMAEGTSEAHEAGDDATSAPARNPGGSAHYSRKRKKGSNTPHSLFFGQLAFRTSAQTLEEYVRQISRKGWVKARLLTHKDTGKSKGQAFVEFEHAEEMYRCLALHHSILDGRVINVERSTGGGSEKKKTSLQAIKHEQFRAVQTTCVRIIAEKVEAGLLREDELDEQALSILYRFDGATAAKILDAYCQEARSKLRNPSSFFMMFARRYLEQEGLLQKPNNEAKAGSSIKPTSTERAIRAERDGETSSGALRLNAELRPAIIENPFVTEDFFVPISAEADTGGRSGKEKGNGKKRKGPKKDGPKPVESGSGKRFDREQSRLLSQQRHAEPEDEEYRGWESVPCFSLPPDAPVRGRADPAGSGRGSRSKYDVTNIFRSLRGRGDVRIRQRYGRGTPSY